jgi:hypothetical protein
MGYVNTLRYFARFQQMVNGLERVKVVTRTIRIRKGRSINKGRKRERRKKTKNRKKMNMKEQKEAEI